jgi:hypothetical protein
LSPQKERAWSKTNRYESNDRVCAFDGVRVERIGAAGMARVLWSDVRLRSGFTDFIFVVLVAGVVVHSGLFIYSFPADHLAIGRLNACLAIRGIG